MPSINHNSPSELSDLLRREGLHLSKRFGQNFLVDASVRSRIAELVVSYCPAGGPLWEIGPGVGSLTSELVARGLHPRLFEIDHGLVRILRTEYGETLPIEVGDFVETGPVRARDEQPAVVAGNLPYASASAMVARMIEAGILPATLVLLVQTEFALRIAAGPGDGDYSAISVLTRSHYAVDRAFDVGPQAFFPRPRVGSRVVVMQRHRDLPAAPIRAQSSELARTAFSQRRKTLRNSLRTWLPQLEAAGIDPGRRPEELHPEDFLRLARIVHDAASGPA